MDKYLYYSSIKLNNEFTTLLNNFINNSNTFDSLIQLNTDKLVKILDDDLTIIHMKHIYTNKKMYILSLKYNDNIGFEMSTIFELSISDIIKYINAKKLVLYNNYKSFGIFVINKNNINKLDNIKTYKKLVYPDMYKNIINQYYNNIIKSEINKVITDDDLIALTLKDSYSDPLEKKVNFFGGSSIYIVNNNILECETPSETLERMLKLTHNLPSTEYELSSKYIIIKSSNISINIISMNKFPNVCI